MVGYFHLRRLLSGVIDELLPDAIETSLCTEPGNAWRRDGVEAYCPRCGASTGPGAVTGKGCAACLDQRLAWDRLYRLGPYEPPMDGWIRQAKFHGHWRWTPWLGRQLAEVVGEPMVAGQVAVCPVPMHWGRRWWRGYNQARLMADALAAARGWPVADVLHRPRGRPPQTAVPPHRRAGNVAGSFAVEPVDLSGWEIVLVDDVKTTGATLTACARLLREAGARSVVVAVAAVAGGGEGVTR
ncbi:MAG: ComF family protein [Phycisphaeraceae bacterium]